MADKKSQTTIVDDQSAKEIYANNLVGTSFDGTTLTVTLGVGRFLPEKTDTPPKQNPVPTVHVAARLTLTPTAALQLANALKAVLDKLGKLSSERQVKA
jgi:hypothetical protein